MRLSLYVLGVLTVLGLVLFAGEFSSVNNAGPLVGTITEEAEVLFVKSPYSSTVLCQDREFRSVGAPTGLTMCSSDLDCRENWPAGASFEFRDRAICACGLCGEWRI